MGARVARAPIATSASRVSFSLSIPDEELYLSSRANNLTGTTRTTDAGSRRFGSPQARRISLTLDATRRRIIGWSHAHAAVTCGAHHHDTHPVMHEGETVID